MCDVCRGEELAALYGVLEEAGAPFLRFGLVAVLFYISEEDGECLLVGGADQTDDAVVVVAVEDDGRDVVRLDNSRPAFGETNGVSHHYVKLYFQLSA